jgi:hypothetical protein
MVGSGIFARKRVPYVPLLLKIQARIQKQSSESRTSQRTAKMIVSVCPYPGKQTRGSVGTIGYSEEI